MAMWVAQGQLYIKLHDIIKLVDPLVEESRTFLLQKPSYSQYDGKGASAYLSVKAVLRSFVSVF